MKTTLIIFAFVFTMLTSCSTAYAGWFSGSKELDEQKQKVIATENQLTQQRQTTEKWIIASGSLGIACIILFTLGAALGSHTRHRHASTT